MSSITLWERPKHWMGILPTLKKLWNGESEFGVLGGLQVLKGFVTEIVDDHYYGDLVLQEMICVLDAENVGFAF